MKTPTQEEWKQLFDDLIPHGCRKGIASRLKVSEGEVSHRFNPHHERNLATAQAMFELKAVFDNCPQAFRAIRSQIEAVLDSWEVELPFADAGDVAKEMAEAISADVKGLPIHVKRKEYAEARAATTRRLVQLDSVGIRKAS